MSASSSEKVGDVSEKFGSSWYRRIRANDLENAVPSLRQTLHYVVRSPTLNGCSIDWEPKLMTYNTLVYPDRSRVACIEFITEINRHSAVAIPTLGTPIAK